MTVPLDGDQLPVGVKLRVHRHEVVVRVIIIRAVIFIVPGQAICHTVCVTIHVLDGEVKQERYSHHLVCLLDRLG